MSIEWPTRTIPPSLLPGEAHVWAVPMAANEPFLERVGAAISPDEQARASAFRIEDARRRFLITRGALRLLLGHYLCVPPEDLKFDFEVYTKPRLAPGHRASVDMRYNVSHSGDLALVAVTTGCEIGVDIEQLRAVKQMEEIAQRYFHRLEVDAVLATRVKDRPAAFFRCWTAKEALLKAIGSGITATLDAFEVPLDEAFEGWVDLSRIRQDQTHSQCWLERLSPVPKYIAAIAFVGSHRSVRTFTFGGSES
jgi:4'-phosphopantetheinyl transferase